MSIEKLTKNLSIQEYNNQIRAEEEIYRCITHAYIKK